MSDTNTPTEPRRLPWIAERVRELREACGLSQPQLAERAGVSLPALRKIEQGKRPDPQWSTVCALARGLGVPTTALTPPQ